MRYSIEGEPLPVVICNLEQGEVMITESGAMSWMSPNMKMETTGGGIGKMFGRALSGESIFLNRYTAMNGNGMIAFASSFPGSIRAFDIVPGQDLIVQKSAFLAAVSSVDLSVFFQQRIGSGLFGERDLLCRSFPEVEPHFWNLMVILKNMNLHPDSRLLWTRDTLQP